MGWQDAPILEDISSRRIPPAVQAARDTDAVGVLQQELAKEQQRLQDPTKQEDARINIASINRELSARGAPSGRVPLPPAAPTQPKWMSAPTVPAPAATSPAEDDEAPPLRGAAAVPGWEPTAQQAAAPPTPAPTIADRLRATLEAATNTVDATVGGGIGMVAGKLGALAGQAVTALRGDQQVPGGTDLAMDETAQRVVQGLQRNRPPTSPLGQEYTENVGNWMQANLPAMIGVPHPPAGSAGPVAAALGDTAGKVGTAAADLVTPSIPAQRAVNAARGAEQGLTYAPHQLASNKMVKMAGEAAEGVPYSFGDMAKGDRQQAFNQALIKHINPESDATRLTPEVFAEAMDRSGGTIGDITSGAELPIADVAPQIAEFQHRLGRTTEDNQRIANGYIAEFQRIADDNDGTIPGANFKALNSELGAEVRAHAGSATGNLLSDLQDVFLDAFRSRLDPDARAQYDTARTEYAKAKTILPLVAKSTEGDISPATLMSAMTASKSGKEAMAKGYAGEMGELARAGKLLVDSKSTNTAERRLVLDMIFKPIIGVGKMLAVGPLAAAYNLAGPAISRAMIAKGLRKAGGEVPAPEVPPTEPTPPTGGGTPPAPAGEPPIPTGEATEITPQDVTPAAAPALDPRLAEIERMRAAHADQPAVQAALDEQAKAVQADIAAKAADAKRMADVAALEKAARGTDDPALRASLQAKADKLRGAKLPVGEVKEGQPVIPTEPVGKIPVGKVIEGQPPIPVEPTGKVPAGQATELPVENVEPAPEPIPTGEATEMPPELPTGEATYATEADWAKAHGMGAQDAARAKNVAKALATDPKAVEDAAVQNERSPAVFDKKVQEIIDADETKQAAAGSEGDVANPPAEPAAGSGAAGPEVGGNEPGAGAPGAVQPAAEQPRPNGPAAPAANGEAGAAGGQAGEGKPARVIPSREEAAQDFPGDEYDRMLHRAAMVGDIPYEEATRRARANSLGQRLLWAKTRAEVEADTKAAVKAAKGERAAGNKQKATPEYAAWRLRANDVKNKAAIEYAQRYGDDLLAVHKERVQEALAEGKDVPPEVLADYPDLKAQANEPNNAPTNAGTSGVQPKASQENAPAAAGPKGFEKGASQKEVKTAAEWAQTMADLQKTKPRPIAKLYGKNGPTPEQATQWAEKMRAWNAAYRKASAMQKATLEAENRAFRDRQKGQ